MARRIKAKTAKNDTRNNNGPAVFRLRMIVYMNRKVPRQHLVFQNYDKKSLTEVPPVAKSNRQVRSVLIARKINTCLDSVVSTPAIARKNMIQKETTAMKSIRLNRSRRDALNMDQPYFM